MNWLTISGEITYVEPLRYTPAGVPVVEATLLHRSKQIIGQAERGVECELTVQASGELAIRLAGQATGTRVRLVGALNRRSVRSSKLMLILNELEKE